MRKLAFVIALLIAAPAYADQGGWAYREWSRHKHCAENPGDTNHCKAVPIDTRPVIWVPR